MGNALVPELYVTDLRQALSFYCDLLGFEIAYARKEEGFAYLKRGEAELMLETLGEQSWLVAELEPPFGRGINFQIQVEDAEALYARCLARGISIPVPTETRTYQAEDRKLRQTQFVVQDPDGYLIRLAQFLG